MALTEDERISVQVFLTASPSVMGITAVPPGRLGSDEAPQISGSCFVWDANHVVTNFHVVDDMAQPFVTIARSGDPGSVGGKITHITLPATVIGVDPLSDIAVLQVNHLPGAAAGPSLLQPLKRATSTALRQGQQVYALGNPFGLESSMSKGVISGLQRTLASSGGRPITGVIQTDTAINPGNSGGPLLNSDGAVIGINAALLSKSGGFAGVSFAIPIDTVERNVAAILSKGYVSRASMGIVFAPDEMSQNLDITGVMVMRTYPGGPAQLAGVLPMRAGHLGDIVVAVDGSPVGSPDDVYKLLDKKAPGESVEVTIHRFSAAEDSDVPEVLRGTVSLGASMPPPPRAMLMAMAMATGQ